MEIESQLLLIRQKLIHQLGLDPEAEVAPIWDPARKHAGAMVMDQPGLTYSLDQDSNLVVQRERAGRIEWARVSEDGEPDRWRMIAPPRSTAVSN